MHVLKQIHAQTHTNSRKHARASTHVHLNTRAHSHTCTFPITTYSFPHAKTHCNTLQHTATYCNALHYTHFNRLTATHAINSFLHARTHCKKLQHNATQSLQHTHCNTLTAPHVTPTHSFPHTCALFRSPFLYLFLSLPSHINHTHI